MRPSLILSLTAIICTVIIYQFVDPNFDNRLKKPEKEPSLNIRLYVMDGGTIENVDPAGFGLKREEVGFYRFPVPCFLIVHPKGTLLWDTGAVPDTSWNYNGTPLKYKLVLPDRQRDISLTKPIKIQLAEIGYSAASINYLALSHYHYDHTGNANEFAGATWLVRQNEYDAMFAATAPPVSRPSTYAALKAAKKEILSKDEYDVFADGTVIIKSAPGHTPGHLVLFLKLAKTGNVVLSGDLYHYPEEKTYDKVPTFEYDAAQTRATRIMIDSFVKKTGSQFWIQHDLNTYTALKKSPAYYE